MKGEGGGDRDLLGFFICRLACRDDCMLKKTLTYKLDFNLLLIEL